MDSPPPTRSAPTLAVVGSFSFDSVLTRDRRPLTHKVGGNALWSALGAHIAGISPRVLSIVGTDFPADVIPALAAAGIGVDEIIHIRREHPVRVTFAHLPDGGRLQPVPAHMLEALAPDVRSLFVDTTARPEILQQGAPEGADVPAGWLEEVDFWHLPLLPLVRHQSLVDRLAAARGHLQTDCPARSDLIGDPYARLAPTLPDIDVFLPSTSDLDVIDHGSPIASAAERLHVAGATTVVVKAGSAGSYVIRDAETWHVPAHPDEPLDPTGAGDAFCGGFLVGAATGQELVDAAALGAAAASFAVATEDPLQLLAIDPDAVRERAHEIQQRVVRVARAELALGEGTR